VRFIRSQPSVLLVNCETSIYYNTHVLRA